MRTQEGKREGARDEEATHGQEKVGRGEGSPERAPARGGKKPNLRSAWEQER